MGGDISTWMKINDYAAGMFSSIFSGNYLTQATFTDSDLIPLEMTLKVDSHVVRRWGGVLQLLNMVIVHWAWELSFC